MTQPRASGDDVPNWRDLAACLGATELFFSEDPSSQAVAMGICWERCPVFADCYNDVRTTENPAWTFGVRAGFSASERRHWPRD